MGNKITINSITRISGFLEIKGVIEKALIGTSIKDIKDPVEIGRIQTHIGGKNHRAIRRSYVTKNSFAFARQFTMC